MRAILYCLLIDCIFRRLAPNYEFLICSQWVFSLKLMDVGDPIMSLMLRNVNIERFLVSFPILPMLPLLAPQLVELPG